MVTGMVTVNYIEDNLDYLFDINSYLSLLTFIVISAARIVLMPLVIDVFINSRFKSELTEISVMLRQ
jgi:hypothetical protein